MGRLAQPRSMPPCTFRTVRFLSPHTYAVPNETLDNTNIMRPFRRIVRNLDQRILRLLRVSLFHYALFIVLYVLTWPLEQFSVHQGW